MNPHQILTKKYLKYLLSYYGDHKSRSISLYPEELEIEKLNISNINNLLLCGRNSEKIL